MLTPKHLAFAIALLIGWATITGWYGSKAFDVPVKAQQITVWDK